MSLPGIASDLQAQIAKSVYIEKGEDGQFYIATPFSFGDGDQPVVALILNGDGWMLSDLGNTMFRLGFQLDDEAMANPSNRQRLDSALSISGISQRDGELTKPLQNGDYADALFDFVHALLKIDELGDFGSASQKLGDDKQSQLQKGTAPMPPKTIEVFEYVKNCAFEPRIVTYGEVGRAVRLMPFAMDSQLDYIQDEICHPRGLPSLSAIVVRKDSKRPGAGFTLNGLRANDDGFDDAWCPLVQQVFATHWSSVKLENDN